MMIDDPHQARRLAHAICSDIQLYNESAVKEAAPAERTRILATAVTEGYRLYANRVSETHRALFEEEVVRLHEQLGAPYHGITLPHTPAIEETPYAEPPPAVHPPVPMRPRERSAAAPVLIAVAVLAAAAAGAAVFLLSHP